MIKRIYKSYLNFDEETEIAMNKHLTSLAEKLIKENEYWETPNGHQAASKLMESCLRQSEWSLENIVSGVECKGDELIIDKLTSLIYEAQNGDFISDYALRLLLLYSIKRGLPIPTELLGYSKIMLLGDRPKQRKGQSRIDAHNYYFSIKRMVDTLIEQSGHYIYEPMGSHKRIMTYFKNLDPMFIGSLRPSITATSNIESDSNMSACGLLAKVDPKKRTYESFKKAYFKGKKLEGFNKYWDKL